MHACPKLWLKVPKRESPGGNSFLAGKQAKKQSFRKSEFLRFLSLISYVRCIYNDSTRVFLCFYKKICQKIESRFLNVGFKVMNLKSLFLLRKSFFWRGFSLKMTVTLSITKLRRVFCKKGQKNLKKSLKTAIFCPFSPI